MAGVQIFRIELADRASGARLTLAAGREFDGYFYLEFGDFTFRWHLDQAARFASAVRRLAWRRRAKTSGAVWRRDLGDDAGLSIKLELGLDEEWPYIRRSRQHTDLLRRNAHRRSDLFLRMLCAGRCRDRHGIRTAAAAVLAGTVLSFALASRVEQMRGSYERHRRNEASTQTVR
jgi:hypothetical protein